MTDTLRLTLGDPCEALGCPLDATRTVVDAHSKPWRVCDDHREYFEAPKSDTAETVQEKLESLDLVQLAWKKHFDE